MGGSPQWVRMEANEQECTRRRLENNTILRRPDLEAILHNATYDGGMREGVRRYLRTAALTLAQEKNRPLTGAYYWVPLPDRSGQRIRWMLQAFFDDWRPTSDHVYVWRHVQDSLNIRWRRSFQKVDYCSLPRGRVCRLVAQDSSRQNGPPIIYHGNDAPLGSGHLDEVRSVFYLPAVTPAILDEHEQMIAGQPEELCRVLGIDLGLKGVIASDLDWG